MSFESICLAQQLNVGGGGSDRPASFQEQMSEMGPKAKNTSLRAQIVRIAPESGLKSDIARGPKSAQERTSQHCDALGIEVVCPQRLLITPLHQAALEVIEQGND